MNVSSTHVVLCTTLFSSLLFHAFFIVLGVEHEDKSQRIEIVFVAQKQPEPSDETLDEPMGVPKGPEALDKKSAHGLRVSSQGTKNPSSTTKASWRKRWQEKQDRFAKDAEIQNQQIASLNAAFQNDDSPNRELYTCGVKRDVRVRGFTERDVSHWAGLVPAGLFSADYMRGMSLVKTRRAVKGMRFALPARVLHVPLDLPKNGVVEIGRRDRRCLVGVRYAAKGVFPIALTHIPVRVSLPGDATIYDAVVDALLRRDGTLKITTIEGDLKVKEAAVYDHESAARSLQMHYAGAAFFLNKR